MQLCSNLRNSLALIPCAGGVRSSSAAVVRLIRDGRYSIRRTSRYLVHDHLSGEPIIQTDDGHAEVKQIRNDVEQRRLLPSMLRRRGGECAAHLAYYAP